MDAPARFHRDSASQKLARLEMLERMSTHDGLIVEFASPQVSA
jgi:hypothetical protein